MNNLSNGLVGSAVVSYLFALIVVLFLHNPTDGYIRSDLPDPKFDYSFEHEWGAGAECNDETRARYEKASREISEVVGEAPIQVRDGATILKKIIDLRAVVEQISNKCISVHKIYVGATPRPILSWTSAGALFPWISVISNVVWVVFCITAFFGAAIFFIVRGRIGEAP